MQGDASDAKDSQPQPGPYWSLMFEVSESTEKAVEQGEVSLGGGKWSDIVRECIIGALNTKMITKDDQIVSLYHRFGCAPAGSCPPAAQPCWLGGEPEDCTMEHAGGVPGKAWLVWQAEVECGAGLHGAHRVPTQLAVLIVV